MSAPTASAVLKIDPTLYELLIFSKITIIYIIRTSYRFFNNWKGGFKDLNHGTVIGLIGENGNGKGTFIKHFKKIAEINKNTFKNLKFSDPLAETLKL